MNVKLDRKFKATVFKVKDGSYVPEDQWVVFLAKDNAFLPTLSFYLEECARQGADERQLAAVRLLIAQVETWRAANPDKCKVPDIRDGEKLISEDLT